MLWKRPPRDNIYHSEHGARRRINNNRPLVFLQEKNFKREKILRRIFLHVRNWTASFAKKFHSALKDSSVDFFCCSATEWHPLLPWSTTIRSTMRQGKNTRSSTALWKQPRRRELCPLSMTSDLLFLDQFSSEGVVLLLASVPSFCSRENRWVRYFLSFIWGIYY